MASSVKRGLGGQGTVATMESEAQHPSSHYEMKEMHIKKADDGSFVMRHEMGLKKRHMGKPGYSQGYRSENPEPEIHTAGNVAELMAHTKKHFGGKSKSAPAAPGEGEPDADDEMGGE